MPSPTLPGFQPYFPQPLSPTPCFGIFAPAWFGNGAEVQMAAQQLAALGCKVKIHQQCGKRNRQFAGTAAERIEAFYSLLEDDEVDAIMALRGGYGSTHLLEGLDYARIAAAAKPIVGFSDVTALLNAITAQTGLVTFHGPMLTFNFKPEQPAPAHFPTCLQISPKNWLQGSGTAVQQGTAEGVLIGGNMTMFEHLIGTPYIPKAESYILFIEDHNEKLNDVEKFFYHVKHAGLMDKVKGVLLGELLLGDNDTPFGQSAEETAKLFCAGPIVHQLSFGHIHNRLTLPVGAPVQLQAENNRCTLTLKSV